MCIFTIFRYFGWLDENNRLVSAIQDTQVCIKGGVSFTWTNWAHTDTQQISADDGWLQYDENNSELKTFN